MEGSTPKPRSILIVDDDPSLRRSMRKVLEAGGYRVAEAATAHEARQSIQDDAPDLVIMDMVLPGMEGREAANSLRARSPELPILYISGYTSQESMRLGQLEPGALFLRKPFETRELLDTVAGLLG